MEKNTSNIQSFFHKIYIDKRFFTFLFFVLVASILWLLNTLGKDYTASVTYPVRFINAPENKEIINELPNKLELKVKGYGYTLTQYKFNIGLQPIIIDINELTKNWDKIDSNHYYILSRSLKNKLQRNLNKDIKLMSIEPDTVHVKLADIITQKVPVHLNMMLDFEEQHMQFGDIIIKPDSVTISGPQTVLDTINQIKTEYIQLTNVHESKNFPAFLKAPGQVDLKTKQVRIHIPVTQYTEKSISVPLQLKNVPDSVELKVFPEEVSVKCKVALDNYEQINKEDFKLFVDYNETKDNINNKLSVYLTDSSEKARAVSFRTRQVEYIIEKE